MNEQQINYSVLSSEMFYALLKARKSEFQKMTFPKGLMRVGLKNHLNPPLIGGCKIAAPIIVAFTASDAEYVGWACLISDMWDKPMLNVYVKQAFRQKKIGTNLLKMLLERVPEDVDTIGLCNRSKAATGLYKQIQGNREYDAVCKQVHYVKKP